MVDNAPEYNLTMEDKKVMYTATLLTLVGRGNPNDAGNGYISRSNMLQMINTAQSGSQFSCFHYQMRNWVSENARNEAYMKSASFAFKNGLPKLTGLVMTGRVPVSAITKDTYGSSKGEGFNTAQIKKIIDTPLNAAGVELPNPRSAIDTWAKVYSKSADLGLQIVYEESLTDLSGRMMACHAGG